MLYRIITFWVITQVVKSFSKKPAPVDPSNPHQPVDSSTSFNMFKTGENLDLYLYYSEHEHFTDYHNKSFLLWHEQNIGVGNWYDGEFGDGSRKFTGKITASENVINNGSVYFHVFFVKTGHSHDPNSKFYSPYAVAKQSKMMTLFKPIRVLKTKNLLSGEDPR